MSSVFHRSVAICSVLTQPKQHTRARARTHTHTHCLSFFLLLSLSHGLYYSFRLYCTSIVCGWGFRFLEFVCIHLIRLLGLDASHSLCFCRAHVCPRCEWRETAEYTTTIFERCKFLRLSWAYRKLNGRKICIHTYRKERTTSVIGRFVASPHNIMSDFWRSDLMYVLYKHSVCKLQTRRCPFKKNIRWMLCREVMAVYCKM